MGAQFTAGGVIAESADEVGRRAAFGGGDRLVRPFAAKGTVVVLAVQGFACLREDDHLRDVVNVAAAENEERFHVGWISLWRLVRRSAVSKSAVRLPSRLWARSWRALSSRR